MSQKRGSWIVRGVCLIGLVCLALVAVQARLASAPAAARSPVINFYFGLKRPESRAIAAFYAVQQPGSGTYRRFLTPRQIDQRYGASPATRAAFVRAMRRLGLSASVDSSGVFARASGTQSELERAFHVRISQTYDDLVLSYQAMGALRLPSSVRPLVREVVGAYDRTSAPPRTLPARSGLGAVRAPDNAGTWIDGCRAARATGAYSFAQVRHAYGIDRVGSGAGGSVAILNDQEGVSDQEIGQNARCFHLPANRVRTVFADGQTRPFGFQSFEPQEDLALVRGTAPGLRSVLLTGIWGDPNLWFLGPAKLLSLPRRPDAVSVSYGYCEGGQFPVTSSDRQGNRLLNALFVRLGLAGVGVFGSAGDSGSTCNGVAKPGVAWPASSPYVTVVGGTRLVLSRANERVKEVVWNDLRWLSPDNGGGAGGGGLSRLYSRPPYQRGLPVPGRARAVPDIAAHASMLPGYPVFGGGDWLEDAGTSAAAPLVASAFAVISAQQRAAHLPPLGPVNGLLYWLYRHSPNALYDIVSGSNRYDPEVPGYGARRGYDLASGLGVPRFARISAALPPASSGSHRTSGLG
jgi:subtilase family serine protease